MSWVQKGMWTHLRWMAIIPFGKESVEKPFVWFRIGLISTELLIMILIASYAYESFNKQSIIYWKPLLQRVVDFIGNCSYKSYYF